MRVDGTIKRVATSRAPMFLFKKVKLKWTRVLMLSEFGGYSYGVPGHIPDKSFGYRQYHDQKKYQEAVLKLYENEIFKYRDILLSSNGLHPAE